MRVRICLVKRGPWELDMRLFDLIFGLFRTGARNFVQPSSLRRMVMEFVTRVHFKRDRGSSCQVVITAKVFRFYNRDSKCLYNVGARDEAWETAEDLALLQCGSGHGCAAFIAGYW